MSTFFGEIAIFNIRLQKSFDSMGQFDTEHRFSISTIDKYEAITSINSKVTKLIFLSF